MNSFLKLLVAVVAVVFLSCKQDKKQEKSVNAESVEEYTNLNATDSKSEVQFSDNKTQKIYLQYLEVKAAMVNTDSVAVQKASKKLVSIISSSEEDKQLKATSKLISLTKNIKKQRDFFVTLTSEIEKHIANAEITSGEVYKQFCPMAFGGEGGYWLSDSKEIRNPYYGNKMLTCGTVKQVLN